MNYNYSPFSPLGGLAGPATILLYASIAFSALTMAFQIYYIYSISTVDITNAAEAEKSIIVEEILSYIGTIYQFIVFIRIGVIYGWFNRSYKNLFGLGALNLSSSPRMAKLSFIIPFYNLWKPYYLFQQIWKVSNPTTILTNGNEWQTNNSSDLIKVAWVTGVLFVVFSLAGYIHYQTGVSMSLTMSTIEDWANVKSVIVTSTIFLVIAHIIFLVCAICYIKIIKQITSWQEARNVGRNSSYV